MPVLEPLVDGAATTTNVAPDVAADKHRGMEYVPLAPTVRQSNADLVPDLTELLLRTGSLVLNVMYIFAGIWSTHTV